MTDERNGQALPRYRRLLSAAMALVCSTALIWGGGAVLMRSDPLNALVLWLMVLPALLPLVLSWFMWRGKRWAVLLLRTYALFILLCGFLLQSFGLGVFSFAPFAIPFISFCLGWVVLSFF